MADSEQPAAMESVDCPEAPVATDRVRQRRWGKNPRQGQASSDGPAESATKIAGAEDQAGIVPAIAAATGSVPEALADASAHNVERRGRTSKRQSSAPAPYVFDMETGDPDDVLTLLLLCANPQIELRAVTLTPGSLEQLSLVRWVLSEVGLLRSVRIGAQDWPKNKDTSCIQGGFYKSFGRLKSGIRDCERAEVVLKECCDQDTTLLTGGPLHNLGAALRDHDFQLGRWVAQGGFAGEGVVPRQLQMKKFEGKSTCQTWNFNGNLAAADAALASPAICRRVLVSKNVCHRVEYDASMHVAFRNARDEAESQGTSKRSIALRLLYDAMDEYLQKKGGKKMHDPLALACAINESVCRFAEVQLFRDKNGWGSRLAQGSGTWISVDYDHNAFIQALLGPSAQGKRK